MGTAGICAAIQDLNQKITALAQGDLLDVAKAIARATDALEAVVTSARTNPFDVLIAEAEGSLKKLAELEGQIHAAEQLPKAESVQSQVLERSITETLLAPALAAPINSKDYSELKKEYESYYDRCEPLPSRLKNVEFCAERALRHRDSYQAVGAELNIPWNFVAVIHCLEAGFNFKTHLHNGDPLSDRTTHVPKGRPEAGTPPFSWQQSAKDALVFEGLDEEHDWSIPRMLYLFEKYNGFG